MAKVDTQTIAKTLAYCEAHCDNDDESRLVEWIAEHIADAIKRDAPRFNIGAFQAEALPIKTRVLRDAILTKLGINA